MADLDAPEFADREGATKALIAAGAAAAPAVVRELAETMSAERRRRLGEVTATYKVVQLPRGEEVRAVRAVSALERVGTPAARAVLERLARGADGQYPNGRSVPRTRPAAPAGAALLRLHTIACLVRGDHVPAVAGRD